MATQRIQKRHPTTNLGNQVPLVGALVGMCVIVGLTLWRIPIEPLRAATLVPPTPLTDTRPSEQPFDVPPLAPAIRHAEAIPALDDPSYFGSALPPGKRWPRYQGVRRRALKRLFDVHGWVRKDGTTFDLVDSKGVLVGKQAADTIKEEGLRFDDQAAPTLISLASIQCGPCLKELGDLVHELVEPLHAANVPVRVLEVLTTLDGRGYIGRALANARDTFFKTHNEKYRAEGAPEVQIPDWMIFPQDDLSHWHTFFGGALASFGKHGEVSLPAALLLDRCGGVRQAILGRLDATRIDHLKASITVLARDTTPCADAGQPQQDGAQAQLPPIGEPVSRRRSPPSGGPGHAAVPPSPSLRVESKGKRKASKSPRTGERLKKNGEKTEKRPPASKEISAKTKQTEKKSSPNL